MRRYVHFRTTNPISAATQSDRAHHFAALSFSSLTEMQFSFANQFQSLFVFFLIDLQLPWMQLEGRWNGYFCLRIESQSSKMVSVAWLCCTDTVECSLCWIYHLTRCFWPQVIPSPLMFFLFFLLGLYLRPAFICSCSHHTPCCYVILRHYLNAAFYTRTNFIFLLLYYILSRSCQL